MGRCGFGPDHEHAISVEQDATASSSDRVDIELGRLDDDPSGLCLEDMFKLTTVPRDIRRSTAHVETTHSASALKEHTYPSTGDFSEES